jgi:hypothetical protein
VTSEALDRGILRRELYSGVVVGVSPTHADVNLSAAGAPSAAHFESARYGRGEVGELMLIEGQQHLLLGRLTQVRMPEQERKGVRRDAGATDAIDVIGTVQLLGSVRPDDLRVTAGVATYPRLGDRVYAAPHPFVSRIPELTDAGREDDANPVTLRLGAVGSVGGSNVLVRPEKLFGRHCAVLGATGGGKSWTVARLVEECLRYPSKVILLDATGEYRGLAARGVKHCHLGSPMQKADGSVECSLPPSCFEESDFLALFEPSGKVQGPKFRAAIRSLRLARLEPQLAATGVIVKARSPKAGIEDAEQRHASALESPSTPFDVALLSKQILEECVWLEGGGKNTPDATVWGDYNDADKSWCLSLVTRIEGIVSSKAYAPVFRSPGTSLVGRIDAFLGGRTRVLRVCLAGVSYEYRAREILVNAIGRFLLGKARGGAFDVRPLLVFVDEAHNFLGRTLGVDEVIARLDAFEIIAREGRKYGLNLCLATQRPRDLTEGVLSQIGTLIVHRITNDRDREVVERACGEIDRAASAFLPSLKSGEAAILGVEFPIPLTVRVLRPERPPASDGPRYQQAWRAARLETGPAETSPGIELAPGAALIPACDTSVRTEVTPAESSTEMDSAGTREGAAMDAAGDARGGGGPLQEG